jgi:hypothetical protein
MRDAPRRVLSELVPEIVSKLRGHSSLADTAEPWVDIEFERWPNVCVKIRTEDTRMPAGIATTRQNTLYRKLATVAYSWSLSSRVELDKLCSSLGSREYRKMERKKIIGIAKL